MSYLVDQSIEMLTKQLLFLDPDSIDSLREAYPELSHLIDDDRLWYEKTRMQFPGFEPAKERFTYQESYRLLDSQDYNEAIRLWRTDVLTYMMEEQGVEIEGEDLWCAKIRIRFPNFEPFYREDCSHEESYFILDARDYEEAIELDRSDLLSHMVEEQGLAIDDNLVSLAAKKGAYESLKWLLESSEDDFGHVFTEHIWDGWGNSFAVHAFLESGVVPTDSEEFLRMIELERYDIAHALLDCMERTPQLFEEMAERMNSPFADTERFERMIYEMDEDDRFFTENEAGVAVVLDDPERLVATESFLSEKMIEYGFEYGSPEIVDVMLEKGYTK